jgi:hypothetical protein
MVDGTVSGLNGHFQDFDFARDFIVYSLGVFTWICVLHWLFSFTFYIIAILGVVAYSGHHVGRPSSHCCLHALYGY